MSPQPVGTSVTYINRAAPGPLGEVVLMPAGIGPGGTGTPNQLVEIESEAKARTWFGDSQGSEAAAEYFNRLGVLRKRSRLVGFGLDTTGWTANTWTLAFAADTTTESGTQWLRPGPHTVAIPLAKGLDETAQGDAAVAAITAAAIPFTASNLAGVVTITSKHVGESANRISMTLNQGPGENGVAGSQPTLVNNAAATGAPASLTAGQIAEIRKELGAVWWVNIDRGSTWIADIDAEIQAGWGNGPGTGLNRYAHCFQAVATDDEATFTTFADKNLRRFSFAAIGNANAYELSASMDLVATVVRERLTPNPRTPTGFKKNPGLVRRVIEAMRPGTLIFDAQNIEAVGGMVIRNVNGVAVTDRFTTNRLTNALAQPDLSEYQLAGMLARRELLERLGGVLRAHENDTIVSDNGPTGATFVSEGDLTDESAALMVALFNEGIIYAVDAGAARALVESVTKTQDVNIYDGWLVTLSAPITQVTSRLEGVAYTTPGG